MICGSDPDTDFLLLGVYERALGTSKMIVDKSTSSASSGESGMATRDENGEETAKKSRESDKIMKNPSQQAQQNETAQQTPTDAVVT